MNWIKTTLALALICSLCACARKKFDTMLLQNNEGRIDHSDSIKYYDDFGSFYLLTFYKTIEKNPDEDFTFEGVSTYKGSQENEDNVEGDSTKIQYLALYFFKNGGVVYHTKYTIAPDEKYVPLDLATFEDLYKKDTTIRKHDDKIEFKRYQPIMQGYQAKKINAQKVVNPKVKEAIKSPKDSIYAAKNSELFSQAVTEKSNLPKSSKPSGDSTSGTKDSLQPISSVIKLYLERGGGKSPIYLLGKHQREPDSLEEAILIEQIFYLQEVQSAGGRYIPALLSEVFDLGTVSDSTSTSKPLFWFRLEKREHFEGNLPNNKQ